MATLQRDLDDGTAAACGRCDRCTEPWYPSDVASESVSRANAALDRVATEIEPRRQWPTGAAQLGVVQHGSPVKGRIDPRFQLEPGRAIARLTDLGWGNTLRELFSPAVQDAPVSEALFRACIQVLAEWGWAERPVAIVSVPSRSHPQLVESVASGLARVGKLPYLGQLSMVGNGPRGSSGGNSAYRLAGVWGGLAVSEQLAAAVASAGPGPILLVDDRVDSRWTMTVAGLLLRDAGASSVLPFALAATA